jgi:hypothetical protein
VFSWLAVAVVVDYFGFRVGFPGIGFGVGAAFYY